MLITIWSMVLCQVGMY